MVVSLGVVNPMVESVKNPTLNKSKFLGAKKTTFFLLVESKKWGYWEVQDT